MELIFLVIMVLGLLYLLLTIVTGAGIGPAMEIDQALEGSPIGALMGLDGAGGEATGLGCGVIAAFLAGFGAVGLTTHALGLPPVVILIAAIGFGWVLARLVVGLLKLLYAQQYSDVHSDQTLIGLSGRVTIDVPAGKIGEAMIESGGVRKYAIREISGVALERGDTVEVKEINGRILQVKKKREEV